MKLSYALTVLLALEPLGVDGFTTTHGSRCCFRGEVAFVNENLKRKSCTRSRGPNSVLYGILDELESDQYDLLSTSDDSNVNMNDAYEMFLADLVFSTNDPRVDIMNKFDLATDPVFIDWLETKIGKSNDPEERLALRDLFDMIMDVKTKVEVNRLADERAAQEAKDAEAQRIADAEAKADIGRSMSTADVISKANAIDKAGMDMSSSLDGKNKNKSKTFYEEEITPEIRLSYDAMLKKVLPPYGAGESAKSIVYKFYDQLDAQFVKLLSERASNGDTDAQNVLDALAIEQKSRIEIATETLKGILALGEPMRMEGAIVKLAREGKVDEALLLLLEANATQARDAGANGPADLMDRLRKRAADEKDKQASSKEIRLLRQLLRTDDPKERETILENAFTPKDTLLVPGTAENAAKAVDGELPEQEQPMPDVPPPDFIDACKAVLLNFGNLSTDDRGDLASRVKQIASEAEVIATRIYGQGMTLREQQDRVWKEQTTSIFDLENMEIEAERAGGRAPWTNPNMDDDMLLPGFDAQGRMQVGGQ